MTPKLKYGTISAERQKARNRLKQDVERAVEQEHPRACGCGNTCEIKAALEHGFYFFAAHRLRDYGHPAPALEALGDLAERFIQNAPENSGWYDWASENGIHCESCEAYAYPNKWNPNPTECGNCGEPLTQEPTPPLPV